MNNAITKTFSTSTGKRNTLTLLQGDIATVPAQAMITAINSGGMWFGGIDGVIQSNAGNQFHNQAMAAMPLHHLNTVVARKQKPHRAMFQDVIFVVDDLQTPLKDVIYRGLEAANDAGYVSVSLPAIRTGVMLGTVEKDAKTAVGELLKGILAFYADFPDSNLSELTFVIYSGGEVYNQLENQTKLLQ